MQVNTVSDHVTHAVIGNQVAREAQISNSAEFFNVLSNTLYSNKKLAVIREVLCNAWDIHIQCGITDKPVEITLTDTKLTIRDFGTGIHDDHIVDVYLTYGNSTKKLDGTQTGGFGLGSKAPWAYVDHFEVTSFHDKRKTIYAMSKSSGEVAGKPSAMPILTVPTDETGLEVGMAIANRSDARDFMAIIRTIAKFGEMNVVLNGVKLETLPFSEAKHGFAIIASDEMTNVSGSNGTNVYIRYGNVVYPLERKVEFDSEYEKAKVIVARVGGNNYHYGNTYSVIFQAKPDTISVTPSRESLSMTAHTIKNVKELLTDFETLMMGGMERECLTENHKLVANTWSCGRPADLLTSDNMIPGLLTRNEYGRQERKTYAPKLITDVAEAGKAYMSRTYPDFRGFKHDDIVSRLKALEVSGFGNRGKIQSFLKEYLIDHKKYASKYWGKSDWFQRTLVIPLMKKLDAVPELSGDKLLVRADHRDPERTRQQRWDMGTPIVQASKLSPRTLTEYMPFLRNFVVISFNRMDLESRLGQYPIMKHWLGDTKNMFVYIVSRTAGKADIAKAFFESQGMTVVDLTKAQSWEHKTVVEPVVKAAPKPRKKGLPKLSAIKTPLGNLDYKLIITNEDHARIEAPEFIVQFNPRTESAQVWSGMSVEGQQLIVELYGDKGGVTVNDNQSARFKAMGIPTLKEWLYARFPAEFKANTAVHAALAKNTDKLDNQMYGKMSIVAQSMFELITESENLAKIFGLTEKLKPEDQKVLTLYNALSGSHRNQSDPEIKDLIEFVNKIPPNPAINDLAVKLAGSKLLNIISYSNLRALFSDYSNGISNASELKKRREGALDLLTYAIEG